MHRAGREKLVLVVERKLSGGAACGGNECRASAQKILFMTKNVEPPLHVPPTSVRAFFGQGQGQSQGQDQGQGQGTRTCTQIFSTSFPSFFFFGRDTPDTHTRPPQQSLKSRSPAPTNVRSTASSLP